MLAAAGKATRLSPWNKPMAYTVTTSDRRSLLPSTGVTAVPPDGVTAQTPAFGPHPTSCHWCSPLGLGGR
jgi:hypothetical protein